MKTNFPEVCSCERNYSGSREEVQLLADKSFGQPEKKLNFWLSSYMRTCFGVTSGKLFMKRVFHRYDNFKQFGNAALAH